MLDAAGVKFWYRPDRVILDGVALSLAAGEVASLLGPNGTGKTTLLRCLLGLLKPKAGTIRLEGTDIGRLHPSQIARIAAYVPQASDLAFSYEAREVVLMGRVAHLRLGGGYSSADKEAAADALDQLGIGHLARRSFHELSGGEKQMVLIARALAQSSKLLIMDEPTANLDYKNQAEILQTINRLVEQDLGIVMTSHYPDHAFLASSKTLLMKNAQVIAQGDPDTTVTSGLLSQLYDTEVHVTEATVRGRSVKVCVPWLAWQRHHSPDSPAPSMSSPSPVIES